MAVHLQKRLLEVSDPSHPDYGRHLSIGEVDALVAPDAGAVAAVTAWLLGETSATPSDLAFTGNSDFVSVTLPVHEV